MITLIVTDPTTGEKHEFTGDTQEEAEAKADAFFNTGVSDDGVFVGDADAR